MKILGIETATIVCGVAVVVDGSVVIEDEVRQKNVHAESIMRLIDTVLKQSQASAQQLDAIAISIGPGSFTGLRIGLSVAKGLCFSLEKPLVAVPTLQALAQRGVDAGIVGTPYILSVLDARRDEVYGQLFRVNGKTIKPEWTERDFTLNKLFDEIGGRSVTVTGDAEAKVKSTNHFGTLSFLSDEYSDCSAATVALIGEQMAIRDEFVEARTIEPKYVKEFYTRVPN